MNEKVRVVRFHKATGVALVRGTDGKLRASHVMNKRLRRIRNNSIVSAIFSYRGIGEIR